MYESVQEITAETVEQTAKEHDEGEKITLRDLIEGQKKAAQEGASGLTGREEAEDAQKTAAEAAEGAGADKELLAARRQLEEVRLRMSVEANIKLLRSGFRIDTAPMEQLIERLKTAEEMLAGQGIPRATHALRKQAHNFRELSLITQCSNTFCKNYLLNLQNKHLSKYLKK